MDLDGFVGRLSWQSAPEKPAPVWIFKDVRKNPRQQPDTVQNYAHTNICNFYITVLLFYSNTQSFRLAADHICDHKKAATII